MSDKPTIHGWRGLFDERQQKEIAFNELYAKDFKHGTDGHNARLIIAKFAEILDNTKPQENIEIAVAMLKLLMDDKLSEVVARYWVGAFMSDADALKGVYTRLFNLLTTSDTPDFWRAHS